MDEPLLSVGDIEESAVGGVEQSNAEWEPDTHDPELGNFRHQRAIPVAQLNGKPVGMHQSYCCKRQRQASDPQDGHLTPNPEEAHAAEEDDGPSDGEDYPEDAHSAEPKLGLGVSGDTKL